MPVMLEYVLLKGINDQPDHAKELKELVQERPFQVNLIPFNSFFESGFQRPSWTTIKSFQHELVSNGITATVRVSGGADILAACGQLAQPKRGAA